MIYDSKQKTIFGPRMPKQKGFYLKVVQHKLSITNLHNIYTDRPMPQIILNFI